MSKSLQLRFWTLIFLICAVKIHSVYNSCHTVIKNRPTGLVLTVSEKQVLGKNETGAWGRFWTLQHYCDGTFQIINSNRCYLLLDDSLNVTVSLNIQNRNASCWFINSDGTIVNAAQTHLALDLDSENRLIAAEIDGSDSQRFDLSCSCCNFCSFGYGGYF